MASSFVKCLFSVVRISKTGAYWSATVRLEGVKAVMELLQFLEEYMLVYGSSLDEGAPYLAQTRGH